MGIRTAISTIALLALVASGLEARPVMVLLDVSKEEHLPSRYGYEVSATKHDDETAFVVSLGEVASGSLLAAGVFFHTVTGADPETALEITEREGRKTIRFSVQTEHLPRCHLRLQSAPIPGTGTPEYNFFAYVLRLDNIRPDEAG